MANKKQELSREPCPLCGEALPLHARGRTLHAAIHGISSEGLARKMMSSAPVCQCGCGGETLWRGWSLEFSKFLRGHMDDEARSAGVEKLKETLKCRHWSRGLTKETSEALLNMGRKTSKTIKERFSDGSIKHWSKGLTADSDVRIAEAAKKRSVTLQGKNHWNFLTILDVTSRITATLGDRFDVISGLDDIAERNNNLSHHLEIRCRSCGSISSPSVYGVIRHEKKVCLSCRTDASSIPQLEIDDFVRGLIGPERSVLTSDRSNPTGYELDVYVPDSSFAVEFNGLYWHSDAVRKDRSYHNRKSKACRQNGISLLHVFQDEWRDKRQIVESMIVNRLGLSKKEWARRCDLVELNSKDSKVFFDDNHIDGDTRGTVTYGLSTGGSVVAAIKLRRPHSKRWVGFLEVARYACARGINVIGGHSRLIKHVMKKHSERLISYVDTRFGGTGRHCLSSGMVLDHVSEHSFWWTDRENRYNRLYCKAVDGRTESEEAVRRRLLKIWGCSNLVFVTP